jgi:ParB family transcriptional regulator, chromosome partitioning protein
MTARHKGLGRGLDALLGGNAAKAAKPGDEELTQLPIGALRPGKYQPRTRMDEASLAELSESIRVRGVIQPIIVRAVGDAQYEILAGERRWRAARMAGLKRIPAIVREIPDQAALAVALIENIQRADLNPLEEATALQRLQKEYKLTHQQCAEAVGRSRAAVSNLLRLLDLNEDVQVLLREGKLEMGHARALLALDGSEQSRFAQRVVNLGLSVRQTEALVQSRRGDGRHKHRRTSANPRLQGIEKDLARKLSTAVRIQPGERGRGRLVIAYGNLEQLDAIVTRIK